MSTPPSSHCSAFSLEVRYFGRSDKRTIPALRARVAQGEVEVNAAIEAAKVGVMDTGGA